MSDQKIIENIRLDIKRRIIKEGIKRINTCLDELNLDQVWHKPNTQSNSVGNLILHLNGNVRQWLLSAIGGNADDRDREEEFASYKMLEIETLKGILANLAKDVEIFSQSLYFDQLIQYYTVQGYNETGLSIIIHVIEHLSYHVGQITYYTKYVNNVDVGYYQGKDLNATNT